MESLQTTIQSLTSMFHERMNQFEADLQNNTSPPSNVAGLVGEFTAFRSFILETLKALQQQVESLACTVDHLEMQGRRKILLFHGVAEENKEDLAQVVVNLIKTKLKVNDFTISAIKRCHRMGRPATPHRHRPILVKLQQVSIRDQVWFSKTKLKGTGITVSEFLTKPRHDLFLAAREKYGVSKCWTRDGNIYVLGENGLRNKINTGADLRDITEAAAQGSSQVGANATPVPRNGPTRSKRTVIAKK